MGFLLLYILDFTNVDFPFSISLLHPLLHPHVNPIFRTPPPPLLFSVLFGTSGALTLLASGTAEELGEHADDDGGGGGIVSLVDASTVTFLLLRYVSLYIIIDTRVMNDIYQLIMILTVTFLLLR